MSVKWMNECVGCDNSLGCMGSFCPNRRVPHLYCDKCHKEVDTLRNYNGDQWCEECILKEFDEVEIDE